MGGCPSTVRIKIDLEEGGSTALVLAYDYMSYLENHPPSAESKRPKIAVPVVLDDSFVDMPRGTHCWLIDCPHCGGAVIVPKSEVASNGFRHGVLKDRSGQVPPHASKATVDALLAAHAIWGCGQPFHIDAGTGLVSRTDFSDVIISDSVSSGNSKNI